MSDQMQVNFSSWQTAGLAFSEVASQAPSTLESVVGATTDPSACGASKGLATVDGAVAIMLSVFGEVMGSTVVPSLRTGLSGEATALTNTGVALQNMEDENQGLASTLGGVS